MSGQELKALNSRLSESKAEKIALELDVAAAKRKLNEKNQEIANLTNRIKNATKSQAEPVVSEHAMLRFFERVLEFDMEAVKRRILNDSVRAQIAKLGNGRYPIEIDGRALNIKVKDNVIVTIET